MAGRGDVLGKALEELAGLGDDQDREQITALRGRLAAARRVNRTYNGGPYAE